MIHHIVYFTRFNLLSDELINVPICTIMLFPFFLSHRKKKQKKKRKDSTQSKSMWFILYTVYFRRKQKLEKEKYLKNADHKVYYNMYSLLLYSVQNHHEPFVNLSLKVQIPNPKSTQFDFYTGPFTVWTLNSGST